MQTLLERSPLASYSFTSSEGINIHVCYQDKDANVRQTFYNGQAGWQVGTRGIVGRAELNNGIAITGWDEGREERVYYLGADCKLVERCYSGSGWYDGEATGRFTASHYSQLAAISFLARGTLCIRIYYQADDNTIREACKNGAEEWFDGKTFPAAVQGSSIAASFIPGRDFYIWMFFQRPDTTFVEYLMQDANNWKEGIFKSQLVYEPGAYITCASYGRDSHRIFTIDRNNKLAVTEFNAGSKNWGNSKQLTVVIPKAPAAAVPVPENVPWVRVYTQKRPSEITEWGTNDGSTYEQMKGRLPT